MKVREGMTMATKSNVEGVDKKYTHEEWVAEATRRFGSDAMKWKFVCPSCGHVSSVQDWKDAGAEEGAVAYSCVGRFLTGPVKDAFSRSGGPCNYAGGGLFRINPVTVRMGMSEHYVFDFATSQ